MRAKQCAYCYGGGGAFLNWGLLFHTVPCLRRLEDVKTNLKSTCPLPQG